MYTTQHISRVTLSNAVMAVAAAIESYLIQLRADSAWLGGVVVRKSDLRSRDKRNESGQVIHTHMCLCHQAV